MGRKQNTDPVSTFIHHPSFTPQPPTLRVDAVSDAQRSRVGVNAVRNQTVENGSAFWDALTGQQADQMGVTVMKLMMI